MFNRSKVTSDAILPIGNFWNYLLRLWSQLKWLQYFVCILTQYEVHIVVLSMRTCKLAKLNKAASICRWTNWVTTIYNVLPFINQTQARRPHCPPCFIVLFSVMKLFPFLILSTFSRAHHFMKTTYFERYLLVEVLHFYRVQVYIYSGTLIATLVLVSSKHRTLIMVLCVTFLVGHLWDLSDVFQ